MRSITAPILLFPEGYLSAFWDRNIEIRIGSKGSVGQA
jgi:hypothetical protein